MTQRLCYYKIVKTLFTIISLFFYEDSQLKSCQVKLPQNIPIMLLRLILITTMQCCLVGGTAQLYDLPQLNYWIDIIKCNFLSPYHQSITYQLQLRAWAENARNVIIESESHIFILNQSMSNASFILFVKGYYQSYDFSKLYLSFHF